MNRPIREFETVGRLVHSIQEDLSQKLSINKGFDARVYEILQEQRVWTRINKATRLA